VAEAISLAKELNDMHALAEALHLADRTGEALLAPESIEFG
jgi:hypothetical protein